MPYFACDIAVVHKTFTIILNSVSDVVVMSILIRMPLVFFKMIGMMLLAVLPLILVFSTKL